MRLPQLRCPCSEIIIKSQESTSKIRAKILIIKENGVFAVCKSCSHEVEVPLHVEREKANPPLIINDLVKKSS